MRFQGQCKGFPPPDLNQDFDAGAFMPSCTLERVSGGGLLLSLFVFLGRVSTSETPSLLCSCLFKLVPTVQHHVKKKERKKNVIT